MQMQIHSIHFDADARLLEFVEYKVGKLNTFHDQIISCEVFLRVEKSDDRDNKVSEVKIHVPGADFFAKRKAPSFSFQLRSALGRLSTRTPARSATSSRWVA